VGDGQTERIYFNDLKENDSPKGLDIFPMLPKKVGSYQGVLKRAGELASDYDKVFALIDMDKIIRENQGGVYTKDKMRLLKKV
jgi:hypothetical protein